MNIPEVRYPWQRPYLAAALETDSQQLIYKVNEARCEIRRRLSNGSPVDDSERLAVADALHALATLESEPIVLDLNEKRPA
jgi:hypothetical protein